MAIEQIKLQLHNHNRIGDVLCMTCAVRDLATVRRCTKCGFQCYWPNAGETDALECPLCKKDTLKRHYLIKVDTSFPELWANNPYLSEFDKPDIDLRIGPGKGTQESNQSGKHMCEAYRESILEKTGNGIMFPQGELMPDIHFSEYELSQPPIIEGRYWILSPAMTVGNKAFSSKAWPMDRWQEVVNAFPQITFVQIGHTNDNNPILSGANLINMVGETQGEGGVRKLLRLFKDADGSVGLVSMHAHISAALKKPAVVIAGAREPVRFELYSFHRYLSNQGTMRCVGEAPAGHNRRHDSIYSCWKMNIEACPNRVDRYAKCIAMITTEEVIKAINDYYEGGMLEAVTEHAKLNIVRKPVFKMVSNAGAFGGGERSSLWIMKAMAMKGYDVKFVTPHLGTEYKNNLPEYIEVANNVTEHCDILMLYANDMVYGLKDKLAILEHTKANKRIMTLNYALGDVGKLPWTTKWTQYIFLCSELEGKLKERADGLNTMVLPPPVDIQQYLDVDLGGLNKTPHIVRVSSQGDSKYPQNFQKYVDTLFDNIKGLRMTLMQAPSFLSGRDGLTLLKKDQMPVIDVLKRGNIFWYMLPDKYRDNGPRVIMEAMAVGLPVVADNRGGAKDRVTEDTGWLCDTPAEHIEILLSACGKILNEKGHAAKERARTEFDPNRWIDVILGM